uniref:Uncharacterized protein n=1 Tax=Anguilla anguilla TaxID=7936 RepID=A0A0E9WAH7_ANGAN
MKLHTYFCLLRTGFKGFHYNLAQFLCLVLNTHARIILGLPEV